MSLGFNRCEASSRFSQIREKDWADHECKIEIGDASQEDHALEFGEVGGIYIGY